MSKMLNLSKLLCLSLVLLIFSSCTQSPPKAPEAQSDTGGVEIVIEPMLVASGLNISTASLAAQEALDKVSVAEIEGEPFAYFADELIVQLPDNKKLKNFLKKYNGTVLHDGSIPAPPEESLNNRKIDDLGYRLVQISPKRSDLKKLAKKLEKRGVKGKVKFSSNRAADLFDLFIDSEGAGHKFAIEPNVVVEPALREHLSSAPTTTSAFRSTSDMWWLNSTTTSVTSAWNRKDSRGRYIRGAGTEISIIDTGFDRLNYDFTEYDPFTNSYSYLNGINRTVSTYDFVDTDYQVDRNGDCINGICWHGHAAALVAAGAGGNHYGTSGVAPNANLNLFRISNDASSNIPLGGWYNVGWAVDTAVAWGTDVISISLSASTPGAVGVPGTYVGAALKRAKNKGVVNVASMGNDNRVFRCNRFPWVTYPTPAIWDTVIGVGAVSSDRRRSSYSNYGCDVTVYAPGGGDRGTPYVEVAAVPDYTCYGSEQCGNAVVLRRFNGTSAAAPVVAGVAALIIQANPSLSPDQVEQIIKDTARKTSPDSVVNERGIVYAYSAVLRALGR